MFEDIILACREAAQVVDDNLAQRLTDSVSVLSGLETLVQESVQTKLAATRQTVVLSELIQQFDGRCTCGRNGKCPFCLATHAVEEIEAGDIFEFWESQCRLARQNASDVFEKSIKQLGREQESYDNNYSGPNDGFDEW